MSHLPYPQDHARTVSCHAAARVHFLAKLQGPSKNLTSRGRCQHPRELNAQGGDFLADCAPPTTSEPRANYREIEKAWRSVRTACFSGKKQVGGVCAPSISRPKYLQN